MLGSHLTLNRLLAPSYIASATATSPLPPSYREKLVTRLVDIAHPFFSLLRTLCKKSWTTEELDDPSSGRLRGDSTKTG